MVSGGHGVEAEAGNQDHGLAVTVLDAGAQPLAPGSAPVRDLFVVVRVSSVNTSFPA
jgi:hypothetical protein